jgi:nucleoside-diphosphate-sugar epimerase
LATAFVTGTTGCLGINLVGELLATGWRVVAMHRATSRLDDLVALPAERVVGDVTDLDSGVRAMPTGVDAVFTLRRWPLMPAPAYRSRDTSPGRRAWVSLLVHRGTGS